MLYHVNVTIAFNVIPRERFSVLSNSLAPVCFFFFFTFPPLLGFPYYGGVLRLVAESVCGDS